MNERTITIDGKEYPVKFNMSTLIAFEQTSDKSFFGENFDKLYDAAAGSQTSLVATNVISTKTFEVKTPDVVIKVSPDRLDLIETREIDGKKCLVIDLGSSVEVNGISVRTSSPDEDFE